MLKGNKIVCINNTGVDDTLKIVETYTFCNYSAHGNFIIEEIKNITFMQHRFISIKEYRKQKLKKIENDIRTTKQ